MGGKPKGKNLGFWVSEEVFEQLEKQLAIDGITKSDLLKTAVSSYLYGDYTIEKNGRKITCSISVE